MNKKPLEEKIYKKLSAKKIRFIGERKVLPNLQIINKDTPLPILHHDYYTQKIKKLFLVMAVGVLMSLILFLKGTLVDKRGLVVSKIERDAKGGKEKSYDLEVYSKAGKDKITLTVAPQKYSFEELEAIEREFEDRLEKEVQNYFAGSDNPTKINLPEEYDNYPFTIYWYSSDEKIVSSKGNITPTNYDETVILTAEIDFEDNKWEKDIPILVKAKQLTKEEKHYANILNNLLQNDEKTQYDDSFLLPTSVGNEEIIFKSTRDYSSIYCLIATILITILIYFASDYDLQNLIKKRREEMYLEYPDVVNKLALYVGAGLSVRSALEKVALNNTGPIYDEIKVTVNEIRSGFGETNALERFGVRTGVREYIKLSGLLIQKISKGSIALKERLIEEAELANELRISETRKRGEKAGTIMLIPMVLYLAIVMIMIMIPAFDGMGL